MGSQYFHRLEDALHGLATDPATAGDPIKRTFLFDGQDLSCNVNILEDSVDVIHVQPNHDEIVLVLEGQCGFRVGEETRRVKAGDLMFIPRTRCTAPLLTAGVLPCFPSSRRSSTARRRISSGRGTRWPKWSERGLTFH